MLVSSKFQVTIPKRIRDKMRITPSTEVDFIEEGDRVYLVKREGCKVSSGTFAKLRGVATVKMTTDEIMALTRGDKSKPSQA